MNGSRSIDLPICPSYHPNSELNGRSGYYPNISETQLEAVKALQIRLEENDLDYEDEFEHSFLKLLRFCRARQFNVDKAFDMVKKDVEWRECMRGLDQQSALDVIQCEISIAYKFFPAWVAGKDKQLRSVSWRQFGKLEIWELCKHTTVENLVRFHAWEGLQAIRLMNNSSKESGFNIETSLVVIDAAGWHLGLATSDAMRFIQGMVSTDSDHFPERLGAVIIINAPSVLSIAWRVISTFLDNVTRMKVQIISNNNDWLPVLLSLIDEDQIPVQYGGTFPDPDPERGYDSMNPPNSSTRSGGDTFDGSTNHASVTSISVPSKPNLQLLKSPVTGSSPSSEQSWLASVAEWLLSGESVSFEPEQVDASTQTDDACEEPRSIEEAENSARLSVGNSKRMSNQFTTSRSSARTVATERVRSDTSDGEAGGEVRGDAGDASGTVGCSCVCS